MLKMFSKIFVECRDYALESPSSLTQKLARLTSFKKTKNTLPKSRWIGNSQKELKESYYLAYLQPQVVAWLSILLG